MSMHSAEQIAEQKVLTSEEQKRLCSAVGQARLLTNVLKRSGMWVDEEKEHLLRNLFVALDLALAVGSVCVTQKRFVETAKNLGLDEDFVQTVKALTEAGIVTQSQFPAPTPSACLIADVGKELRLYDERNFYAEVRLAEMIASLAQGAVSILSVSDPREESRRTVELALKNRLTVVSGGPGTGKTTAVMKILKALLEEKSDLKIVLAAPTGKAAGRMQQAVVSQAARLDSGVVKSKLESLTAQTLHRLLLTPMADGNRPSAETPLDCDVLVVDESSMIDVNMAVWLLSSIDVNRTKVILLGDRHQLAAVGPGAVFADLSDAQGVLADNISHLTHSHRFAADKAVGMLSAAVNAGDEKTVIKTLTEKSSSLLALDDDNTVEWHRSQTILEKGLTPGLKAWLDDMIKEFVDVVNHSESKERTRHIHEVAQVMQRFGVLCAQRRGNMSVAAVNRYVDEILLKKGFPNQCWRQIIVRQNDDVLEVHNGDIGLVVPGCGEDALDVYFADEKGQGRFIKLGLLPNYELAFAITIHQSQGSEYERVAVVMPTAAESALATRELLYTAMTRVKDGRDGGKKTYGTLDIFSEESVLKTAVKTPVMREGALPERLTTLFSKQ